MFGLSGATIAQNCPPNIDFEEGTFSSWTCLAGITKTTGVGNLINMSPSAAGPLPDRHQIISRIASLNETDHYGKFPVVCPNGSNYSVKLGNNRGKHEAEGIAYNFTIPADRNTYSLVYHYAVVFQNSDHKQHEQPRLEIEIKNVSDNKVIDCSSVSFIAYGTPLPGFFISQEEDSVWCKDWTAVTVNLNGYAGKDIRLTFKTADCVFQGHFGYAYIDVDANCAEGYTGSAFCKDDTLINVAGPYGFASYKWFNENLTAQLSTDRVLTFRPPPPSGTTFALELIPFNGYGCADTVFIKLTDTLTLKARAGNDVVICGNNAASLGEVPRPGVVYTWSPANGLSDAVVANPVVNAQSQQRYILTVANNGGGCKASDTVLVFKSTPDTNLAVQGKSNVCITSGDSAVLVVNAANKIQWYKDEKILPGENKARYKVTQPGKYFAQLQNTDGCTGTTPVKVINMETATPGITYPLLVSLANTPLTLNARNLNGEVEWSPPLNLNDAFSVNPVYTAPAETDMKYEITITTKAGCVTTDYQPVKTLKEVNVFVPGAFTPNGDGRHDYLRPVGFGADPLVFKIYDRWGRLLYSMKPNAKGWDGSFKGSPQDAGTYVWYLTATGIDGKTYNRKGTVLLLR